MASYEIILDPGMIEDAINEYMTIAEYCINAPNKGCCFGFPATLLLMCVIDAIGTYRIGEQVTIGDSLKGITEGEPFQVLNHESFGLVPLSSGQLKHIQNMFRNPLAHNGMIAPGCHLNAEEHRDAFVFNGNESEIRLRPLLAAVKRAWNGLDKDSIRKHVQNPERQKQMAAKVSRDLSSVSREGAPLPTAVNSVASTSSPPLDLSKSIREM